MRRMCMLAVAGLATAANADFGVIDNFNLNTSNNQAHGISTDGNNWFVAQIFSPEWDVFDLGFNYVSTTFSPGGAGYRGVTYNEQTGTMFVGDHDAASLRECELDGTIINTFPDAFSGLNAVSAHRLDGDLWVATFSQGIFHYNTDGDLLDTFQVPFFVTGLAIDEAAGTLLILESSFDEVYEYDVDGNALGIVVPTGMIPDNGQGLYYDAYTATLYATTQTGPSELTILQDPDRPVLGNECFADCDGDGSLTILDFVCYQTLFQSGDKTADCNGDGSLDILDFVCYQEIFQDGCD